MKSLSHVRLFVTPWTAAHQTPPSMGFSRQEYWSGLPFPSPRNLPNPGIETSSPTKQAEALTSEPPGKPLVTEHERNYHISHSVLIDLFQLRAYLKKNNFQTGFCIYTF